MKKNAKWPLTGVILAGILAFTGCGSAAEEAELSEQDPQEFITEMQDAMNETDSFTASFEADIAMGDGTTLTKADVTKVEDPFNILIAEHSEYSGTKMDSNTYMEPAEDPDTVNIYKDYDGQWTEMTMEKENAGLTVRVYDAGACLNILLAAGENWKVTGETGGVVTLEGCIPEGKVFAAERDGRFFQLAGMSGLSENYFEGTGDVPITIGMDRKEGAPVFYSIDLTKALGIVTNNVLKEMNGGTVGDTVAVEKYLLHADFTKLGGIDPVPVPAEAKDNAINYEEEISLAASE